MWVGNEAGPSYQMEAEKEKTLKIWRSFNTSQGTEDWAKICNPNYSCVPSLNIIKYKKIKALIFELLFYECFSVHLVVLTTYTEKIHIIYKLF